MHVCQHEKYYVCLMDADDKKMIMPDMAVRQYDAFLTQVSNGEPLRLLAEPAPKRTRRRLRDEPAAAPMVVGHPLSVEDGARSDGGSDGPLAVHDDVASSSASGGEPDVLAVAEPMDDGDQWFIDLLSVSTSADLPTHLHGQKLGFECCLRPTRGPPYVRRKITCTMHDNCFKNRNCTFLNNFGPIEVVGYLGCWLEARSLPEYAPSREAHMGYRPTVDHVREYLRASGHL